MFGKKKSGGNTSSDMSADVEKTSSNASENNALYSPELEHLIEMVLEYNEVTDREIELLANRAEKEGVDPLEFEIAERRFSGDKELLSKLKLYKTKLFRLF